MTNREEEGGMADHRDQETREAARILKQAEQDSQSILLGGLPSYRASPSGDEHGKDVIERWGRRIGRSLAIAAAIAIVGWFVLSSLA